MASPVAELETGLTAMLGLRAPGVSGSRITNMTALCVNNVQSESVLIQKIYTHFKKAPGTHKLGVLYVVDSVTRKWMDQAKAQGQAISSAAQDGTYAAGVHRVTELMPVLMNDIIASAPEDQKEKIKKLIDIWEKGQTFPPALLTSFKDKLNAPPPTLSTAASTTPPGSPPANNLAGLNGNGQPSSAPPSMPSIMEALANIARQNAIAAQGNPPAPAPVHTPTPAYGLAGSFAAPSAAVPTPAQPSMPTYLPATQPPAPPVNMPTMPFAYPQQQQQNAGQAALAGALQSIAASQQGGYALPPAAAPNPAVNNNVQQQLILVQTLAAQGIPIDKITSIIALMGANNNNNAAAPAVNPSVPLPSVPTPQQHMPQPTSSYSGPGRWDGGPNESRDHNGGYRDGMRSPRHNGRSRSRSPSRWDDRNSPHNRNNGSRGGYQDFGRNSPRGGRAGGDRDYRQRSPPPTRRGFTPEEEPEPHEKWVEFDPKLTSGNIKVLSRTLFVGGVTCSEAELRGIFSRHGKVQTCIVNKDKRHAFVKMYYRKDAVHAKEAMEENRGHDLPLRTRWGVGFGPRDCSDYQTGVSIIPIHKLTEADRKWMLTAPFGGSGGRPIVTGLCVEEPDIEIGAGVSSKAISRRMQTDKSGHQGPRSTKEQEQQEQQQQQHEPAPIRGGGGMGGGDRGGRERWSRGGGRREGTGRREERMNERNDGGAGRGGQNGNEEPVVLGFPPGITMGPNGINFQPGFGGFPNGS